MAHILVTGGSGFIGSSLINYLLSKGHHVSALLRGQSTIRGLEDSSRVNRIQGDLHHLDGVKALFAAGSHSTLQATLPAVDTVIHLAGIVSSPNREEFERINTQGTINLAELVAKYNSGAHFVFVSSQAAAGPSVDGTPKSEGSPSEPVSAYGLSKLQAERALESIEGLQWTIVRPPVVFGEGDPASFFFFKSVHSGWVPLLLSSGTHGPKSYSLVTVGDVVGALMKLIEVKPTRSTYFVTTTDRMGYREFLTEIDTVRCEIFPKRHPARFFSVPPIVLKIVSTLNQAWVALGGKSGPLTSDKLGELLPDHWVCTAARARDAGLLPKRTPEESLQALRAEIGRAYRWYVSKGWLK